MPTRGCPFKSVNSNKNKSVLPFTQMVSEPIIVLITNLVISGRNYFLQIQENMQNQSCQANNTFKPRCDFCSFPKGKRGFTFSCHKNRPKSSRRTSLGTPTPLNSWNKCPRHTEVGVIFFCVYVPFFARKPDF